MFLPHCCGIAASIHFAFGLYHFTAMLKIRQWLRERTAAMIGNSKISPDQIFGFRYKPMKSEALPLVESFRSDSRLPQSH